MYAFSIDVKNIYNNIPFFSCKRLEISELMYYCFNKQKAKDLTRFNKLGEV